ncbi:MAG: glycosyltransferase [Nanoarchaeota archaeon]
MKKVIWISSYLPRSCGIAYYSADYIGALRKTRKVKIKIISHTDALEADYPVIDVGNMISIKDTFWHKKVFNIIKKEKPYVVHIQHEYGLYETYSDRNQRVLELLKLLKDHGIKVVMTYHTIFLKLEKTHAEFVSASLKLVSAGIFHEEYQKDALKKNIGWQPDNVYVLPHGSSMDLHLDKEKIRKSYNYDHQLVVGCAGLADERKGFRTLIKQWPKVVKKFPNAILSLEVKPHVSDATKVYIDKVLETVMKSPVGKNIEFIVKDYSKEEFYKRLKCFDVLALPYKSESQSGVLAHGFAAGVPAIVTDIEGLGAEIRNSKAGIAVKDRRKFYMAIIKMLSSKKLRDRFSRNAENYVKNVSGWNIIARKTLKIYNGL